MNWVRFRNRLLGRPATHEHEFDEELDFHEQMKHRELRASGASERDAQESVRRSMGNLTLAREQAREAWTFVWLGDLARDMRYGARALASQPGFTMAAVLALVLGIGVNAILFNVYNAVALAPWAIRDAGHTVQVFGERGRGRWNGFSWPEYRYLNSKTRSLAGLAASTTTGIRVTRGEASWNALAIAASENFFDLIGTGFTAGRGFSPSRSLRDPAPEIILQYDTWIARFGGDRNVLGEWLDLNGHRLQVVGIAAPGFIGPSPTVPQLWVASPWRDIFHPGLNTIDNPNSCCVAVVGRLKPGSSRKAAEAELGTLSAQFLASVKREPGRVLVTGPALLASPSMSRKMVPMFVATATASLLILLLACANVANLQLARAVARRREIAVRLSLGAGRGRILRQLLVESFLVSGIAGTICVAISAWAPAWIVTATADSSENLGIRFVNDWRVLAFVLAVTFMAAMLFGLAPAWRAVRDGIAVGIREGGRTTATGRLRTILLGAQVALCAILLSGATLLVRALSQVRGIDVGFRYSDVIRISPNLESSGVTDEQARRLLAPLLQRVEKLPGVVSVAHATVLPLGNSFDNTSVPDPRTREQVMIGFNQVSATFFETLGIPLVAGRPFTAADEGRTDLGIVTEAAAKRLWPRESAIGKTLLVRKPLQVIGVVRDFSTREIGLVPELNLYVPSQGTRGTQLLIRHSTSAEPFIAELPKVARQMDRRFMAVAAPYEEIVVKARRSAAVSASLAGALGSLALLLACVGIYGVAAYNVVQRTREIGVRVALGARPRAILIMILRQNLRTVLLGAAIGIGGAIGFARLLTSMLYGVKPDDPPAMLAALAILLGTALAATWTPATRASAVDPAITLRHE